MPGRKVRYFESFDGAQIAYAISGSGPPVVLMPSWLTHLEYQDRSVAWQPWLEVLESRYTLVRYDPRGCGMSERDVSDLSFETWVRDFEGLVEKLGLEQFATIGICQGGAVAINYAERNPGRISHLILYGAYARGRNRRSSPPLEPEKARVMIEMIELGWRDSDRAFMRSFATQFQPEGSMEHLSSWCELQRRATCARNAVELTRIMFEIDISRAAERITCPTLVAHGDRDAVAPVEEGRFLAQTIPNATFLELDTPNHLMLRGEPAWRVFTEAMHEFLPTATADKAEFSALTARESEVLHLVARGLDNHAIGARLSITEKTVRNHLSAILDKLGSATRVEAVVRAREAGYGI
ncbi:MAG: alpha/beta fold hydrolase [Alphaproteobacteria bacterium]|nr:alpha/beta fold hydrolase [Alphaproteobacteria bacterium]MBU0805372.1 alpha/beta fold hydrolase [Alphaproteobacteria bacterium]MBU0873318.1 alpha/beta fold hydrolase [Alphaproteobacteria bacterium]MBU1401454.1 alpha/beta fold hydrolase [Alphaproteobacteria bacterium]MBU1592129.1 alpha/beta fold hydrolase [Alphaproteobacteria bacterium]